MPLRDGQILCERTAPTTAKIENGFKNKNFIVLTSLTHPAHPSIHMKRLSNLLYAMYLHTTSALVCMAFMYGHREREKLYKYVQNQSLVLNPVRSGKKVPFWECFPLNLNGVSKAINCSHLKKLFLKSHSMWFKVFLQEFIKLCNRKQRIWGSETSTQIRWKRVEGVQAFPMENAWAEG